MPETGSEPQRVKGRFSLLTILMIVVFMAYSVYLLYLQAIKGSEYRSKAQFITRQTTVIPAQRGEIYDRAYDVPLVLNIDSFAVDVVPADIPAQDRDTVFSRMALALSMPIDEIRKRIPPAYYHLYQQIEVKASVPYTTVTYIAEHADEFPGVSWRSKPMRNYLETGSFSHLIGYVGDITREELKILYNQGYQAGDVIGKSGIEKQYDAILRGRDGREQLVVDVKGRKVAQQDISVERPIMGMNLVLTIDRNLQSICEKALGERMGSVVALRPSSGEILAMVSYPVYNPNLFSSADGNKALASLLVDQNTPLINRAIQSSYPPASTFKIVLTAGVLEEKSFPPDQKVLCPGEISYGDRVFRCWIRKPGHGWLDLGGALAQSCDVYFWTIGRDHLGVERIVSYAKEFGFGSATGIDLPGELSGFIPTPQWKERRFHEKWLGGDTMNFSIGQGYMLVTPLQMVDMIAVIANGGKAYRPHILKEVRDASTGALVRSVQPEPLLSSRIAEPTFSAIRSYLRGVITVGSARFPVSTKAVEIAGKTGTAEVGLKDRWHSWFASYAPFSAPPEEQIVLVVMVEASNPWEWWAPYASNIIYQAYFAGQTYEEAVAALGLESATRRTERVE